jgi:hypothetical protein
MKLTQTQTHKLYAKVMQYHEAFFHQKFETFRDLFITRKEYLSFHRQITINWQDIAADCGIAALYAHELFRKLEVEHLDKLTTEEKNQMKNEINRFKASGCSKLELKKLVKGRLVRPERLQYKSFDNAFERIFRELCVIQK